MGKTLTVLGTGAWGTTLAHLLSAKGFAIRMWEVDIERARAMAETGRSPTFPDLDLGASVSVTDSISEALDGAALVIVAVPATHVRTVARAMGPFLPADSAVLSASKGMDLPDGIRLSQVFMEEAEGLGEDRIAVLSGPNLAAEVIRRLPAVSVVASASEATSRRIQEAFASDHWRLYRSPDVLGVEMAGALKNVIAIGAGIIHGLDMGDNARSALITRGLAEITRLGTALGADPRTFMGVAGVGDLVATCSSSLSRNQTCGRLIARGMPLDRVKAEVKQTIEGIPTTRAVLSLASRKGVEMPIAAQIGRILFEGKPAAEAIRDLMVRRLRPEFDDGGNR